MYLWKLGTKKRDRKRSKLHKAKLKSKNARRRQNLKK